MTKEGKRRLIPWLVARINSNEIKGLKWLDQERSMFRIPWKHGGKQSFDSEEDSRIFRDWAVHTGKYSAASDKADPTKWKQNLRCAFNKSKEIEEVKNQHCLEGTDPYKVYRIKKNPSKSILNKPDVIQHTISEADSTSPVAMDEAEAAAGNIIPSFDQLMCKSDPQAGQDNFSDPAILEQKITSGDLLNTVIADPISIDIGSMPSFPDVLPPEGKVFEFEDENGKVQRCEVLHVEPPDAEPDVGGNLTVLPPVRMTDNNAIDVLPQSPPQPYQRMLPEISKVKPSVSIFNPHPEMLIRVQYLGQVMFNQRVNHAAGYKIRCSNSPRVTVNLQEDDTEVFGNNSTLPIDLPPFSLPPGRMFKDAEKRKEKGMQILDAMYRGIEVFTFEGDVYIKRLCKCNILYETKDGLTKIARNNKEPSTPYGQKVFNYQEQYKAQLEEYQSKGAAGMTPPSPFVHLVCGQKKFSDDATICISVASKLAFDKLLQIDPSLKEDDFNIDCQSSLFFSKSDEFDEKANLYKDIENHLANNNISIAQWTAEQAEATRNGDFELPNEQRQEEDMDMEF